MSALLLRDPGYIAQPHGTACSPALEVAHEVPLLHVAGGSSVTDCADVPDAQAMHGAIT